MKRLRQLSLATAIGGFLAVGLAGPANAAQLGYEPFLIGADPAAGQYTVGGANTQNPTNAFFTGPWLGTTGTGFGTLLNVQEGSPTKPMQINPSQGGSLSSGDANFDSGFGNGTGPFTGSVSTRAMRQLASPWTLATNGEFWMSFLISFGEQGGTTGYRAWELWNDPVDPQNGADDPQRTLQFGYSGGFGDFNNGVDPYDGNKLSVRINNDATTAKQLIGAPDIIADDGKVHCVAVNFSLSDARNADSVKIYLDPMGTNAALLTPNAEYTGIEFQANLLGGLATFMFETNSTLPGSEGVFDELRVGTTFADVACCVPEPATFSLVGLGAMGLLFVARRKRA